MNLNQPIFNENFTPLIAHLSSYKILAPKEMEAAKEPKDAAAACLEKIELDADKYRIGHTKAGIFLTLIFTLKLFVFR